MQAFALLTNLMTSQTDAPLPVPIVIARDNFLVESAAARWAAAISLTST